MQTLQLGLECHSARAPFPCQDAPSWLKALPCPERPGWSGGRRPGRLPGHLPPAPCAHQCPRLQPAAWGAMPREGGRRGAHHMLYEDTDTKPLVGQAFPESQPQQSALSEQLGMLGGGTQQPCPRASASPPPASGCHKGAHSNDTFLPTPSLHPVILQPRVLLGERGRQVEK